MGEGGAGRSPARILLASMLAGGGLLPLCLGAFQAYRFGGASTAPVAVDLASLEAGTLPPDRHLRIGDHVALLQAGAVWASATADMKDPATPIDMVWYPIFSPGHPLVRQLAAAGGEALEDLPRGRLPALKDFAVLVQSRRFKTLGDLTGRGIRSRELVGLSSGRFGGLPPIERDFVAQTFPGIDPERVMLVEEGVVPPPPGATRGLWGFGGLMVVLALLVVMPRPRVDVSAAVPAPRTVLAWVLRGAGATPFLLVAAAAGMMARLDVDLYLESAPEPLAVELAAVERGAGVPNPHVRLGRYRALYDQAVGKGLEARAGAPGTRLGWVYVPLVAEVREGAGGARILLKTKRFPTAGEVPTAARVEETVAGMILGPVADAPVDRRLLEAGFDKAALAKMVVLQEGRTPPAWWEPIASTLLALVFAGLGFWILLPPAGPG